MSTKVGRRGAPALARATIWLGWKRVGEARHRIDSSIRTEHEDARSAHTLFPVAARRNPIGEYRALTLPDVALPPQADARHKPLGRANVSCQIGETVEQAE